MGGAAGEGATQASKQAGPVFSILPQKCEIPPKTAVQFTVSGLGSEQSDVEERLQCVTGQGSTRHILFDVLARYSFIFMPALM